MAADAAMIASPVAKATAVMTATVVVVAAVVDQVAMAVIVVRNVKLDVKGIAVTNVTADVEDVAVVAAVDHNPAKEVVTDLKILKLVNIWWKLKPLDLFLLRKKSL